MATRSSITVQTAPDQYESIYCHWDGYPSHVGRILKSSYASYQSACQLIAIGNISTLREKLHPASSFHSYMNPEPNTTIAYGRDRGETGQSARKFKSIFEILNYYDDCDYHYLLDETGSWKLITRCGKLIDFDETED